MHRFDSSPNQGLQQRLHPTAGSRNSVDLRPLLAAFHKNSIPTPSVSFLVRQQIIINRLPAAPHRSNQISPQVFYPPN